MGDLADVFEGEGGVSLVGAQDFQIVLVEILFGLLEFRWMGNYHSLFTDVDYVIG